jgi:hypothetical protein
MPQLKLAENSFFIVSFELVNHYASELIGLIMNQSNFFIIGIVLGII